jgi:hypothetical protein
MCDTIATQFIGHDLPWLTSMTEHKSFEKALGSSAIPLFLKIDIDNFAILIHRSPKAHSSNLGGLSCQYPF